ncbi:MAG: X-Pro aminopeptidase, partial [Campylobacteraceae bacterium]|nr:X-Pro aminopeptidase [Campylobacteraceae bacterium]
MRATLYISESAQKDITNFQCDNAIVIKYLEKSYFITDGRYTFEAKNSVKENVFVIEAKEGLEKSARLLLRELGVKKALYDPS